MSGILPYSTSVGHRCTHAILIRCIILFVWVAFYFLPGSVYAQDVTEYDEIFLILNVPGVGSGEISSVIKDEEVYLPVTTLFDFLKIRNIPSAGLDSITGFIVKQEMIYTIDRSNSLIRFGKKVFALKPGDLIRTESDLYLRAVYYGQVFGLDCIFDFRNMSVILNTRLELPVIREIRQAEMRLNINRLKGEEISDTTIRSSHPMFRFGMADWSVITSEEINRRTDARLNLALGAIIAGGETTVSLNYNKSDPFTEKQQYYLWRYVNNDFSALRQVMAGKIATHSTSSIWDPVVGVQFTNTPTTFRHSFGSYTMSDQTEPGWTVELYVNNVLVDFVKSDASGFFKFEVPLVYGNSMIVLKFYGPWGEERTLERNISIPFSFLPKNTLEYTVSAGMVEDTLHSRFSRSSVSYGLTRGVTIGAGFEYLSSVSLTPLMPYVKASFRLSSNLLFSGEYTHFVRAKGTLTYRLPSNLQIDINYIKYDKDQMAIYYNYLEERRIGLSIPVRIKKFSAYNRFTINQLVLPTTNYTTAEWLFSSSIFGANTNITTYAMFVGNTTAYVYSNLSLALLFPGGFTIIPQAQYGFTDKRLISAKISLEKRVMVHGFLNVSYEHNYSNNLHMGEIGFRYDFKFAQTGFSAIQTNKITTLFQYARGSLIYDHKTKYLGTDNRTNVGRGGITLLPYLDINSNGKQDRGEPKVHGLKLRTNAGRIERNERDTTIRILSLEPYSNCFIEFDQSSFDNVAWRLVNITMSVAVDPDVLKYIEIPVIIVGEASGTIFIEQGKKMPGLARMIVNFYDENDKPSGRTLTEEDGYYSFLGLAPGAYIVRLDTTQLRKLRMTSSPDSIKINISANKEGDLIEELDFKVKLKDNKSDIEKESTAVKVDSALLTYEHNTVGIKSEPARYAIQLGAFRLKTNAVALKEKLTAALGKPVKISMENGFYKVRITGFRTRKEAKAFIPFVRKNGFKEMWVTTLKGI
jgi:hypothetical protein